ncbi:MAG: PAS domain-containing protein [Cyanobacteriota bacterium]
MPNQLMEMQERIALLERLTANVPGMLYQLLRRRDGSMSFSFITPCCHDIYEVEPEVILENASLIFDRIHPEDRASFDSCVEHSGTTLEPISWEGRITTPSGKVKWLSARARPEQLNNGDVLWDGLMTDITDQKQTELAWRESELQLRMALNASQMGTWDWNLKTNIITWSERTEEIFGYAPGTFDGTYEGFIDRIHPEDRDTLIQACTRSLEEKIPCSLEYRLLLPDGTIRWVAQKGDFLFDDRGQPLRLSGVMMDITERKLAEEKLKKNEANLLAAQRIAHVGSWEFDVRSQKLTWSQEKFRIFGLDLSKPEPTYLQLIEMIHPDDRPMFEQAVNQALASGTSYEIVFRIKRPNGQIRHIETKGEAVFNGSGQIIQLFGTVVDITERKLAEEETLKALQRERELSEAKSRFIAMASHEFRTPLTTIQSSADLLNRYSERLSPEKQQEHFKRISSGVEEMNSMVQDVLLLSEVEAGKLQFNPAPVDLVQLCWSLVADLQMADNHQHNITFNPSCDSTATLANTVSSEGHKEGLTQYVIDEKLLRYTLKNLLSNALKYSPQGSTVQFDLTCHQNQVILKIQDQGIGIPSEAIPRLFDSFYRASNVGTIQGTGLGLAIAKQCVDLHGGQITVDSSLGTGTTFTIRLPLTIKIS